MCYVFRCELRRIALHTSNIKFTYTKRQRTYFVNTQSYSGGKHLETAARQHQRQEKKSMLFLSFEFRKHHFLERRLRYRGDSLIEYGWSAAPHAPDAILNGQISTYSKKNGRRGGEWRKITLCIRSQN